MTEIEIVVAHKTSRLPNGWRLIDRRVYRLVENAGSRMLVFYENVCKRGPAFTSEALDKFLRGFALYTSHGRIEWRRVN